MYGDREADAAPTIMPLDPSMSPSSGKEIGPEWSLDICCCAAAVFRVGLNVGKRQFVGEEVPETGPEEGGEVCLLKALRVVWWCQ